MRFHVSSLAAAAAVLLAPWASGGVAWAHKYGIQAYSCDGCHSGGKPATVQLSVSPQVPDIGQMVTVTITVSQTNGPAAGFFITTARPAGTFKAIQSGTAVASDGSGVTHSMPRIGSGGVTTFQVGWSTSEPTGVQFTAFALSANNDGTPRGDAGGEATLSITDGCSGADYYLDQDTDGYGTANPGFPVVRDCKQPMGYAPVGGDCDDFDAATHPGAPELCDGKDNNCDGNTDENVAYQTYCQDKDGDGHGVVGAATKTDCRPSTGFGDCGGDCNDNDATMYPGAPEICDGRDNNCDGRVDEGARAICGTGWCASYAIGCTTTCTPGTPRVETCNLFDDDCDGVADNGTDLQLCGAAGLACVSGRCVPAPDDTFKPGASSSSPIGCALARGAAPGSDLAAPLALGIAALAARRRGRRARKRRR